MKKCKTLTNDVSIPVTSDQASITTDKKAGYTLLEDAYLQEKLAHFNRERIPERVVHAKGGGAHGYFEVTNDLSCYTCAKFLNQVGKKTDIFMRFSTVGGEKGSADTLRDPRGFAIKFYTEDGNYDLVGNNTPIFFIRDGIKFPDFIHTQKRHPKTHLKDPNMFWDFLSLTPESLHQVMRLFSNLGTPDGFRHMDGFGSHTFMWYNEDGDYVWVKYHMLTDQGVKNLTAEEAERLAATEPDYAIKDLYKAIEDCNYPSWKVYVQIMHPEEAESYKVNPFDVTKTWYEEDYPLIPLGKLVLNENPKNYFQEVEQIAFSPSHFVPGIWASPDKLLQARLMAYDDAHRYRLGTNYAQIPINRPKGEMPYTNQRDGRMRVDGNMGDKPNYYPTTFECVNGKSEVAPPTVPVVGEIKRHEMEVGDEDYIQAGEFFENQLDEEGKAHFIFNIGQSLKGADINLQYREGALLNKANQNMGKLIATYLGLSYKRIQELSKMSPEDRVEHTMPQKPY